MGANRSASRSGRLPLWGGLGIAALTASAALAVAYLLPATYESSAVVGIEPQPRTPAEVLRLLDGDRARVLVADTVLSASGLAEVGAALPRQPDDSGLDRVQAFRDALSVTSSAARRYDVTARAESAEGALALASAATRRLVEQAPAALIQAAGIVNESNSRVDEALGALSDFVARHPEAVLDKESAPAQTKLRSDPALIVLRNELQRLEKTLYEFQHDSEKSQATENPYDDPSRADTDEVERMKRRAVEINKAIAAREGANRRTTEQPKSKAKQAALEASVLREQWLERVRALKRAQEQSERTPPDRVLAATVLEPAVLPENPVEPDRGRIVLFGVVLGVFAGSLWWGALGRRRAGAPEPDLDFVPGFAPARPPPLPAPSEAPAAAREAALSRPAERASPPRELAAGAEPSAFQVAPAASRAVPPAIPESQAGGAPYRAPHALAEIRSEPYSVSSHAPGYAPPSESQPAPSPRDADHLKRVAVVEVNVAGGSPQRHRAQSNTAYSYVSTAPPARRIKTLMGWPSDSPEPQEHAGAGNASASHPPGEASFPPDPPVPQLVPAPVVVIGRPIAVPPESTRAPQTLQGSVPPQAAAPQANRPVLPAEPIYRARPAEPPPRTEADFTVPSPSPRPRLENAPSPVFPYAVPSFHPDPTLPLDALRPLRNRLYPLAVSGCFVVLVLSTASQSPVKSRVATGLAVLLAQAGHPRVLLVETDFGRPEVHLLCSIVAPAGAGFSQQLLARQQEGRYDAWRVMHCTETLDVLPEGAFRTLGLAAEQHVPAALRELRTGYDLIVVNGATEITEAEISALDGVVDGVVVASAPDEPPPSPLRGFSGRQVQMQVVVGSAATAAARGGRG